jgi:processive 1,2-diacylglycerol beta-glucosyltransferase
MHGKILICYSNAGNGPISASRALADALEIKSNGNFKVVLVDVLEKTNPAGYFIVKIYNYLLSRNLVWNTLGLRLFYTSNLVRSGKLLEFSLRNMITVLEKEAPDVIVFTNPWIIGYVIRAVRKMPSHKPKLISMVIDIGTYLPPSWFHKEIDLFIVATEEAKKDLIKFGALSTNIKELGIPIDKKFLDDYQKMKSSKDVVHCEKCVGKPNILVIGGREGSSNLFPIFKCLLESDILLSCYITVLCGKNKKIKQKVEEFLSKYNQRHNSLNQRHVHPIILDFVEDMHLLMKSADVIITKPGAITVWEATTLGIPLILDVSSSVMGQEVGNVLFVETNGLGFLAKNIQNIPNLIKLIINDVGLKKKLEERCKYNRKHLSTNNITDAILEFIG